MLCSGRNDRKKPQPTATALRDSRGLPLRRHPHLSLSTPDLTSEPAVRQTGILGNTMTLTEIIALYLIVVTLTALAARLDVY